MPAIAISNGVRISPRKVAVVASLVRGRSVADALTILEHTPRRSAKAVADAVKSAKANAEHNHSFKPDTLVITEISVMAGARFKRFRPAARGRALKFERKTSNIRVIVDGTKRVAKKTATPATEVAEEAKETK